VVEASGNGCLAELMRQLQDRIVQARRTSLSVPGNPRRFHQHHGQVLEAIRAGQAERAGRRMEQHVLDARARLLSFLSRTLPDGGDGAAGAAQTTPAEGRGRGGGSGAARQGAAGWGRARGARPGGCGRGWQAGGRAGGAPVGRC